MTNYISVQTARLMQHIDRMLISLFGKQFPPPGACCITSVEDSYISKAVDRAMNKSTPSIHDIWSNGILWAVPKHRRTVEKRMKRKFGIPDRVWKLIRLNTKLRVCNNCGNDYQVGELCPYCYNKVKKETEEIQTKIQEELKLDPIEKDVVILYDGEKNDQPEIVNGKRIVEMKKPRPMWFSKNLMQKSTVENTANKPIKPDDLV